jgi:sugar lactone lactonase YvrE
LVSAVNALLIARAKVQTHTVAMIARIVFAALAVVAVCGGAADAAMPTLRRTLVVGGRNETRQMWPDVPHGGSALTARFEAIRDVAYDPFTGRVIVLLEFFIDTGLAHVDPGSGAVAMRKLKFRSVYGFNHMVVAEQGVLYISERADLVTLVSGAENYTVFTSVPGVYGFEGLAYSAATRRLYFSENGIAFVDLATRATIWVTNTTGRFGAIAVAPTGEIYAYQTTRGMIYKIAADGVLTYLAGSGSYELLDGPAWSAGLGKVSSLFVDGQYLWLSDGQASLRVVDANGYVSTLETKAGLAKAPRLAMASDRVFVADGTVSVQVFGKPTLPPPQPAAVVAPPAELVPKFTIGSEVRSSAKDGTKGDASFGSIGWFWCQGPSSVFLVDTQHLREVTAAGVVTTKFKLQEYVDAIAADAATDTFYFSAQRWGGVGRGSQSYIGTGAAVTLLAGGTWVSGPKMRDGKGAAALFTGINGLAFHGGAVYVADTTAVRRLDVATAVVTTIAKGFIFLESVVVNPKNGDIFAADGNRVSRITTAGVVTRDFAGSEVPSSANGVGTSAGFVGISQMAIDDAGFIFVADASTSGIRVVDAGGGVTTYLVPIRFSGAGKVAVLGDVVLVNMYDTIEVFAKPAAVRTTSPAAVTLPTLNVEFTVTSASPDVDTPNSTVQLRRSGALTYDKTTGGVVVVDGNDHDVLLAISATGVLSTVWTQPAALPGHGRPAITSVAVDDAGTVFFSTSTFAPPPPRHPGQPLVYWRVAPVWALAPGGGNTASNIANITTWGRRDTAPMPIGAMAARAGVLFLAGSFAVSQLAVGLAATAPQLLLPARADYTMFGRISGIAAPAKSGDVLFVSDIGKNAIFKVSVAQRTAMIFARVTSESYSMHLAVDDDGRVYAACRTMNRILRFPASGSAPELVRHVAVGPNPVDVAIAGNTMFIAWFTMVQKTTLPGAAPPTTTAAPAATGTPQETAVPAPMRAAGDAGHTGGMKPALAALIAVAAVVVVLGAVAAVFVLRSKKQRRAAPEEVASSTVLYDEMVN